MSRTTAAAALVAAAMWAGSAAPVVAQQVHPQPDRTSSDAVAVLLEQARFWSSQQQDGQALASLRRALDIDPRSADALAMAGQLQADQGDHAGAEAIVRRLRAVAPDDSRLEAIDRALRIGPIRPEALAEARQLSREGRQAEAVVRYNAVLRGNPPPDNLAVEYYQTLSGTLEGWDQARAGLARVVTRDPQDLHAQLAYAQVLTYREETRADGLDRLASLSRNPTVADAATQSWRRALLWLPSNRDSVTLLQPYLADHPGDVDVAGKLAAAQAPAAPVDQPGQERQSGFDQLNAGHLAEAAQLFEQALETDANDADALGGLGIVRLRQGRLAEARTFLDRAVALDPAHRDRWDKARLATRPPSEGPNPATLLMRRGDYAAAERELRSQIARGVGDPGLGAMLGDALARQGRFAEAGQAYRSALLAAPSNAAALVGLADVLARQGRLQEATDLLADSPRAGAGPLAGQAHARLLREQARLATSDPVAQLGLLRAAVQADPASPWARLDLSRLLVARGRLSEARATMAAGLAGAPSVEALRAGVIFAQETRDAEAVTTLVARLPAAARTPELRAAAATAVIEREVAAAATLSAPAARERLLQLAAKADPDGSRGTAIARELSALKQTDAVREALLAAQAATPGSPPKARIAYAGVLLGLGDRFGAQRMLANFTETKLTDDDRAALDAVRAGIAVQASDRLNERGQQAEAFDELAPMLASQPGNADLMLALARLYQGAKRPSEALTLAQQVLAQDSGNAPARQLAVDAALAAGRSRQAAQIVQSGSALYPNDPRSWVATADLARARGDPEAALRDLRHARSLRERQGAPAPLGEGDTPPGLMVGIDDAPEARPFGRGGGRGPGPAVPSLPNPFRAPAVIDESTEDATPASSRRPQDKLTEQIDRDIASLEDQVAPAAQASLAYRSRSGQTGLDRLDDLSAPIETDFQLGGQVRATLTATPVFLSSGSVAQDVGTSARFGLNALALGSGVPVSAPVDQTASGVGLTAAATFGSWKADIGVTPVGFPQTSVVGGVEWAPLLSDHVRLRVSASRRPVIDSLLSYAGTRVGSDATLASLLPGSAAARWGGVVSDQGRAGLEVSVGPLDLHASVSGGVLTGHDVHSNEELGADTGASFAVYKDDGRQVRIGLDLVYFGYEQNLRFFSYGQGGYFSPQSYFAALLPLVYREDVEPDLAYEVGLTVGLQSFREQDSPLYPTRPDLQARVERLTAGVPSLASFYPGQGVTGFAGGAHASVDYRVSRNLHVGARLGYQHAEHYDQASGLFYGRYVFSGRDAAYP